MSSRNVKTSSLSVSVVVVVVLVSVSVVRGQVVQCVSTDGCSCILDDGRVIDVSSIGKTDGTPYFVDVLAEDTYKYSYNPCTPFTEGSCQNAAVCQESADNLAQYMVGTASSAVFSYDGQSAKIYYTSYTDVFRQAWVTFICDPSATTPSMRAIGEQESTVYYLEVTTACGCPDGCTSSGPINITIEVGLSGGSILLIVFFVLLFVYLVGGIIFNRTRREAQGLDMVPNITFWKALPGLVKDGFVLVFGRFSGKRSSYENV